jgi:biotin carboxylase
MQKLLLIDAGDGNKSFIFDLISDHDIELYLALPTSPKWATELVPEDHLIVCDVYSHEALLSAVESFCSKNEITFDGVGTYYDFFVTQMAKLSEHYDLPNISLKAAERSSANKNLMRTACKEAGVEMPKFELINNATSETLVEAVNNFGFPCVVKPIIGSKSYGVKLFTKNITTEDIDDIFSNTDGEIKDLFRNFTSDFLIEEYLDGMVVSVDGFIQNKSISFAGIIEFVMGPEPYFTQEANYIPARIQTDTSNSCYDYVTRVITALGFDNCGFHCELRITKEGPRLIEIACRLPGGPLQLGYQRAYGYNLASNMVDIWLNKSTSLEKTKNMHIAQKAVYDYTPGTLVSASGIKDLDNFDHVWASAQLTETNSEIITYPQVPEPIYFYATEADSAEKLSKQEAIVENSVSYEIKQ